ncbi:hypothetical protein SAMN06298216_1396 [Spirosomataceae bacterium TFI 002]|nr:hypothetical protein SAMN06298216_1396 [Spirosomataceae bacterium TFI 002]
MRSIFFCFWFLIVLNTKAQVTITESNDEGMRAYKIETQSATYFYQTEAGGFSSIIDTYGNDWINFKTEPKSTFPASAASDYRGLPNLVHGGPQGGLGHPGFSKCTSTIITKNTIRSTSNDGKWEWEWRFFPDHAKLNLIKTDPSRSYWFLYEGTIGGNYEPENDLWGTNVDGLRKDKPDFIKNEGVFENWQTVYFGDKDGKNTFFISQDKADELDDVFGFMGNTLDGNNSLDGMVVFGFGRGKGTTPLLAQKQSFTIGLIDKSITKKSILKKIKRRLR